MQVHFAPVDNYTMNLKKLISKVPKRVILILIIILAITIPIYFSQRKVATTPQSVIVKRGDIKSVVSASGSLNGQTSIDLKFKSSGKLAYLNVQSGSMIEQGQVIAGLDTQDLAIALQQAQNNLRSTQATVDKTLDDIHLFQYGNGGFSNVGTANETQSQRQIRMNAEATRDNAYDSVKAAQRAFQDTVIISPISGVVTKADLKPGQFVSAADIVAHVVDFSKYIFEADVDEADISKIQISQDAQVTLNAYGDQVFNGKVAEIVAQTKTSTSGGTTVTVKIVLDHPNIQNIQGLEGQANIVTVQKNNVLLVPQESIIDNKYAVTSTQSGLRLATVTEGLKSDTDVEITSGLSEGQEVIKTPTSDLVTSLNQSNGGRGGGGVNRPIFRFFRGFR